MRFFGLLSIIIFVVSCATNPIDKDLDQIRSIDSRSDNDTARVWLKNYRKALDTSVSNRAVSCELFKKLSSEKRFPLRDIAKLRALENCSENSTELKLNEDQVQPWANNLFVSVSLLQAHREQNLNDIYEFNLKKSKWSLIPKEKVDYSFEALKAARRLNNSKKINYIQSRIYKLSPRLIPRPKYSQYLSVAKDFRRNRNFKQALIFYTKILKTKSSTYDERYAALRGIRSVFRLQRTNKMPQYILATKDVADFTERRFNHWRTRRAWTKRYHDSQVSYARTLWSYKSRTSGEKVLKKLSRKIRKHHSRAQIFWLRARMSEEIKHYNSAIYWLERAQKEKRMNAKLTDEIHWHLAWNSKKLNRLNKAAEYFNYAYKTSENPFLKNKVLFWFGKTLIEANKRDQAKSVFKELIAEDPLGYYGLLAYRELGDAIPPVVSRKPAGISGSNFESIVKKDQLLTLEWLIAVGEKKLSKRFLDQIYKKISSLSKTESEDVWVSYLKYYAKAGQYLGLFEQLGKIDSGLRKKILEQYPQLLFPQPYRDHVETASKNFNINQELIYSIMRQESAFNPFARSHADAFGLMQLIPEIARKTARYANIDFDNKDDLYDPETNIQLGSAFLQKLLSQYNNNFLITVASYNASEKAIKQWINTRFHGDPLQFIEDIPYSETQGYIKLVLRNLVFYQRMNSEGQAIYFPEWCLQNLQDFKS